jgi:alpha-D-ribose 1-methylphosphonate 5-triphosphate synthase subunit PhnH
MKTVAEYRAYAAVCRRLMARVSRPEDKQALETVARAWEQLADEREDRLLKQIDGDTLIITPSDGVIFP